MLKCDICEGVIELFRGIRHAVTTPRVIPLDVIPRSDAVI